MSKRPQNNTNDAARQPQDASDYSQYLRERGRANPGFANAYASLQIANQLRRIADALHVIAFGDDPRFEFLKKDGASGSLK
jgi:hypothetical protein